MGKPIARRIYELTRTYQRLHPEIIGGVKQHGRIALKKRASHMQSLSKILIRDSGLRRIYNGAKISDVEKEKTAANYLIKKFKGNPKLAKQYVLKIRKVLLDLTASIGGRYFSEEYLERIAKKQGLKGREIKFFVMDTKHVGLTPLMLLPNWLNDVSFRIDLMSKKGKN